MAFSKTDSLSYVVEVQTYYFNINISLELGCNDDNGKDDSMCFIYQPIRVLRQYNNNKTRYYIYIRDRITLAGVSILSDVWNLKKNNKKILIFRNYDRSAIPINRPVLKDNANASSSCLPLSSFEYVRTASVPTSLCL